MQKASEVLHFECIGSVARLTLNRPRAMNALNMQLVSNFERALDDVESNSAIRAVILTGSGAAFCAGADLKDAMSQSVEPGEWDFLDAAAALFERISALPKPVIASLNGVTMAGGLELAMCADLIVAADNAVLADAHANYGVFPGAGGAAVLPRLLPLPTAMYLLLTGKSLPAARLYELGLICEIHPADQLAQATLDLANQIAQKSPSALRRMKEVARSSMDKTRADALLHERVALRQHMRSADLQEGLRAFAEKRAPQFTGR
jgi:enoyl-CoA hydratase/carnithine racemase